MGPLAAYSIKSAILLSALFAIYMLALGRKKWPSLRRFSLLGICIASLSLPLLYAYRMHIRPVATVVDLTPPAPNVTVSDNFTPFIFTVIAGIIASGICVGIVISIIGLIRILTIRTTTVYSHGFKFKLIDTAQATPFCFCGSIYISKEDLDDIPEMIITHEHSHIRHLHFIDLFIGRLTLIAQWWNPFAWMLCREMRLVHEFQADGDVLSAGYDSKEYQYLLLARATTDTKYSLTSGFRHCELKRRLKMINRQRTGRRAVAALIMVTSSVLLGVALPSSPVISYVNGCLTAIRVYSFRDNQRKDTVKSTEGQPHVILNGTPMPYGDLISIDPQAIKSISVWKDQPEYPDGVIEIETKPGMSIYKPDDSPKSEKVEEIKVIGYGMQKRTTTKQ
ncbi:MAG: hypothetical protein K2N48_00475 [Muribaculaceae bacterium]|nr:hypothetical protein [Muribaculaceae bacterium]